MKQAYQADEIFTGDEVLYNQVILTEENFIKGFVKQGSVPSDYPLKHFPNCFIAPAFIDLQIYGGNGKLFSNTLDMDALEATHDYCVAGGAAYFMITMATNSMDNILKGIHAVEAYWATGKKGLIGLHLEGPWINPIKKGAHIASFIKKPTLEDAELLLENGQGTIKMITLAPEQCDEEIIDFLLKNEILISAGHSSATYEDARHAFKLGIPAATHLFNAMSPLQGREPGLVGAIYDDPGVMCSIICDGIHVDFATVRISKKIMGRRLFFITDAVTASSEGFYPHVFHGNRYTMPDGTLSGSCMTMISTFRNAVQQSGISIEEALKMCSVYPGSMLKNSYNGKIMPGNTTNMNIIDKDNLGLVSSVFN